MNTRYHAALSTMLVATIQLSGAAREVDAAMKALGDSPTEKEDEVAGVALVKMREVLAALLHDVPNMADLLTVTA